MKIPSEQDYLTVMSAVNWFISRRHATARHTMLRACDKLLTDFGVKSLKFPQFTLKREGAGIRLEARTFASGRDCPQCGVSCLDARIIQIRELGGADMVTYGCPSCFQVYGVKHYLPQEVGVWEQ